MSYSFLYAPHAASAGGDDIALIGKQHFLRSRSFFREQNFCLIAVYTHAVLREDRYLFIAAVERPKLAARRYSAFDIKAVIEDIHISDSAGSMLPYLYYELFVKHPEFAGNFSGKLAFSTVLPLIYVPSMFCIFGAVGIKRQRRLLSAQRELEAYWKEHKAEEQLNTAKKK